MLEEKNKIWKERPNSITGYGSEGFPLTRYFVPAHDELGVGGRGAACSGGVSGRGWAMRRFSLDLVSEKKWEALGPPRVAEIRYASIWIGGEAWRGR